MRSFTHVHERGLWSVLGGKEVAWEVGKARVWHFKELSHILKGQHALAVEELVQPRLQLAPPSLYKLWVLRKPRVCGVVGGCGQGEW